MSTETTFEALSFPDQVAALAYGGNAYGLLDRCGANSTHLETDTVGRLAAAGYAIVRVTVAD